jgi:hypothetical protein
MLALLIAQTVDTTSDSYESGYAVGRLLVYIFIAAAAFILIRRVLERRRKASEEGKPALVEQDKKEQPVKLEPVVENGSNVDTGPMEAELENIYRKLGAPDGIGEAKGKVRQLARDLSADQGINPDEALYRAYKVSLDQHREYVSSQGS